VRNLGSRPQSLLWHAHILRLFKFPMHLIPPVIQRAIVLPLLQGHGRWEYGRVILQLLLKNLLFDVFSILKHFFQGQGFHLRVVLLLGGERLRWKRSLCVRRLVDSRLLWQLCALVSLVLLLALPCIRLVSLRLSWLLRGHPSSLRLALLVAHSN
jgi:hypothetical protein